MNFIKLGLVTGVAAMLSACGGGLPESCDTLLDELDGMKKQVQKMGFNGLPTRQQMEEQLKQMGTDEQKDNTCKMTLSTIRMMK